MMWRRGSPGRTTTRAVRYWMASRTLPFLPMMRPASGPSISMRISSGEPSPSFGATSTSTAICIRSTSVRTNAMAFLVCASSVASSIAGVDPAARGATAHSFNPVSCSSDTSFSLSQRRGHRRAFVLVLRWLAVRPALPLHDDVAPRRRAARARKELLDRELLRDPEHAVRQHVDAEGRGQEEHHHREDAGHEPGHHLLLHRVHALLRHDPLLNNHRGTEDEGQNEVLVGCGEVRKPEELRPVELYRGLERGVE